MKVLHVISINNKKPIPKKIKFKQPVKKRVDILELFIPKYRLHTTLSLILWSFTFTSSYGLQLLNTQLDQTIGQARKSSCHSLTDIEYLQDIFVVLGQVPGLLFYILFADKISRKTAFISTYIIILACLLLLKFSTVFL
ncbi:synaptic vesicle 2-related protein-like [Hydractinia symbiolongicarpus]|uniref:synaptic vesicle 2-related protein-like n=1 Tax=Hydractinia symbiolongicarpus TaxID=13093 RepID=UPI00254CAA03|nr:synaptic vesicle 2-related protein-like [Hydractinia symbiolongicarpus]